MGVDVGMVMVKMMVDGGSRVRKVRGSKVFDFERLYELRYWWDF